MLEIRLLGQQRLVVDGVNVTATVPPRSMALLAQLVLHPGEEQPRAALAALFWPESTDEQSLTNLRRELHQLRGLLPEVAARLTASGRTVAWQPGPDTTCDVVDFLAAAEAAGHDHHHVDRARSAVATYSGELLPAWSDEWVLVERDRLHRRCLELLDVLVDRSRTHDDVGHALAYAQRRLDMEPLSEPAYRTVMELQATSGDRAGALRTYHRCASLLERSLGVTPDPATVALYESLLGPAADQPGKPPRRGTRVGRLPLVGRDAEVAGLVRRWQAARRGRSGLHLLTGEAGVGKTRLLSELAAVVQRRDDVAARARCFAGGASLPMAPVAEWLSSRSLRIQRDGLDPVWASEVERLVPDAPSSSQPPPQPMVDGWQRHRFVQGLVQAVLVSGRPTLLTLDDVQWCDPETLTWLHALLREAHGRPVLVLATARAEEVADNPDLGRLLRALGQEGRLSRTAVEPLDGAAARALARSVGANVDDEDALLTVTRGYPLFVIEAARAAADGSSVAQALEGSSRVQAVLEGRLAPLSDDAATVAGLAAVVGRDFDPELLEDASDLPDDAVAAALDELWQRRLLVQRSQGTYDFAHDLLRDAVLRQLSAVRMALLHRRVGQALELRGADGGAVAARVAHHYEQAGVGRRALPFHVAAAGFATRRFAYDDAVAHFSSARRQLSQQPAGPERDRRELELLHAMSAAVNARHGYASPQLQEVLERATLLAGRLRDRRLELLSLIGLFSAYIVQGRVPESYAVARRALSGSDGQHAVVGQAHFAVAGAATMLGRHEEALQHFALVPPLTVEHPPSLVGTRPEVHSRAWEAHTLWLVGRQEEARAAVAWAVDRAREVDHPYSLAVALAYDAMLAQFEGRRDAVAEQAAATIALCHTYGFAYYGDWARVLAGWARGGARGLAEVRAGLASLDAQGAQVRRPYYWCLEAELLADLGDLHAARRTLEAAVEAADRRRDLWWLPDVLRRLALLQDAVPDDELLAAAAAVAEAQGSQALAARVGRDRMSLASR